MKPSAHRTIPARSLLALAALTLLGAARAESGDPEISAGFGLGLVSGDKAERGLFGQYNGLRRHDAVGLFELTYYRRDDDTGRSVRLDALNLLGDTRQLDFRWREAGHWKVSLRYDEQVRHEPNTVSSGADLKVQRSGLGLGMVKTISRQLKLELELRSEDKEGSRLFGVGMTCPSALAPSCGGPTGIRTGSALLLVPEPIDANHTQLQARLNYAQGKLRLSGGYHGSFYRNRYGSLSPDVPSVLNNALGVALPVSPGLHDILSRPVALAPDNQAHTVDLTGSYAFTPTTRATFKLSRAQLTQTQDFTAAGFSDAPAGVSNLGGRVDTTRALFGLTARPLPTLSRQAKLRYEDRDDRTPVEPYNVEGTSVYTNRRLPLKRLRADLQANYQFTNDVRGTLGAEHESIDRGVFTATSAAAGISALRQDTDETSLRAELRRRMNESFSGSIALVSSRRTGSNWLKDNSGLGVTEITDPGDPAAGLSNAIFMPTLADRQRDKIRLAADWQPSDDLALQLRVDSGRDHFDTPSPYGLRSSRADQISVDASYAYSFAWRFNGYLSHGTEALRQARVAAAALDYDNASTTVGIGVVGRLLARLDLGADLSFVYDRSVHAQTPDALADGASVALLAASGGLPEIVFRQALTKLHARYEFDKRSAVRVDLVHQWSKWNDWAWGYGGVPFTYADGTSVGQPAIQQVTFIGVSYIHRW